MRTLTIITVMSLIYPVFSLGAVQGSLGNSSQGNSEISSKINSNIVIKKIDDIDFGSFAPGNAPSSKLMNFCVGINTPNKKYTIKASSDHNNNNNFRMTLGGNTPSNNNEYIVYSVTLDDGNGNQKTLSPGVVSDNSGNGYITQSNLGCSNESQSLTVDIDSSTDTNWAGNYKDTLTLLVSPL